MIKIPLTAPSVRRPPAEREENGHTHMKRRLVTASVALGVAVAATGVATLTAQAEPTEPAGDELATWTVDRLSADQATELEELGTR